MRILDVLKTGPKEVYVKLEVADLRAFRVLGEPSGGLVVLAQGKALHATSEDVAAEMLPMLRAMVADLEKGQLENAGIRKPGEQPS